MRPLGGGTFPPSRRASDRPMAIACLRLVTFFPDPPERRVPSLRSCMAFLTFSDALAPYFLPAMEPFLSTLGADCSDVPNNFRECTLASHMPSGRHLHSRAARSLRAPDACPFRSFYPWHVSFSDMDSANHDAKRVLAIGQGVAQRKERPAPPGTECHTRSVTLGRTDLIFLPSWPAVMAREVLKHEHRALEYALQSGWLTAGTGRSPASSSTRCQLTRTGGTYESLYLDRYEIGPVWDSELEHGVRRGQH